MSQSSWDWKDEACEGDGAGDFGWDADGAEGRGGLRAGDEDAGSVAAGVGEFDVVHDDEVVEHGHEGGDAVERSFEERGRVRGGRRCSRPGCGPGR